jgi:hypothetical protein
MQDNMVAKLARQQSTRVQSPLSPPLLNVMYCASFSPGTVKIYLTRCTAIHKTQARLKIKVPKPRQYQKLLRVSPGELAAVVVHCDQTECEYGVGSGGLHVHPSRFRRSEFTNISVTGI